MPLQTRTVYQLLTDSIKLARPEQYVKNLFIFLPIFFGGKLFDPAAIFSCFVAFCAFSLAASSIYVFNDIIDVGQDRLHPVKKERPIAKGRISIQGGYVYSLALIAVSVLLFLFLRWQTIMLISLYFVMNVFYSVKLKHIAILDVVCISLGFIIRVYVGTIQGNRGISHWLFLMTFLIAMFLALAKRRDDLLLARTGNITRRSLDGYSFEFVSLSMILMSGIMVVSYIMFTTLPEVITRYGTEYLYLTTFWVILGILRYLQITFVLEQSGSPTKVILKDRFMQITITLWVVSYIFMLYF